MTDQANPIVSVVIPCFNQGKYIFESVLSAKLAYVGPVEIIIVNDGSTEFGISRTLKRVREFVADERCSVRIVDQLNQGLPAARNAGIATAKGEFVQLLDADDLLTAGKIDEQIRHFGISLSLDVSISDCLFSNDALDQFEHHANLVAGFDFSVENFALHWERGFSIPIHCALFRRTIFDRIRFNERVRAKEDWIFWVHLVVDGFRLAYLGSKSAIYRVHNQSICRSLSSVGKEWIKAAVEIEAMVGERCPGFMDAAVAWYVKTYSGSAESEIRKTPNESGRELVEPIVADDAGSRALPTLLAFPELKTSPRISIVVPIFNHYDYLCDCLNSLAIQEANQIEIILVDDASTDSRVKTLLAGIPKDDATIRVLHNSENVGIAETQNRAVERARGEYIAFLDCDDRLPAHALTRALAFIVLICSMAWWQAI
jgi:glycosyltransferase involved in cell wall biosynthesis